MSTRGRRPDASEGDAYSSPLRQGWVDSPDPGTRTLLEHDASHCPHHALSTPCLVALVRAAGAVIT